MGGQGTGDDGRADDARRRNQRHGRRANSRMVRHLKGRLSWFVVVVVVVNVVQNIHINPEGAQDSVLRVKRCRRFAVQRFKTLPVRDKYLFKYLYSKVVGFKTDAPSSMYTYHRSRSRSGSTAVGSDTAPPLDPRYLRS